MGGNIKNDDKSKFTELEMRNYSDMEAAFLQSASILKREYLNQLTSFKVCELPKKLADIQIKDYANFYKLTKIVYNEEENFIEKLTTITRASDISGCSIITIISSDGEKTDFWIGTANKTYKKDLTSIFGGTLEGSINGNFQGSDVEKVSNDEISKVLSSFAKDYSVVSSISNVASLRNEDGEIEAYVQGIENLVEALRGKKYSIITIADPISNQETSVVLDSLEQLYSQLSGFEKTELSLNENSNISNSDQYSKSFSSAIGHNTTISQSHTTQSGWSNSSSETESRTSNMGAVAVAVAGIAAVGLTVATGGLAAVAGAAIAGTAVSSTAIAGGVGAAALTSAGSVAGGIIGSKTKGKTNTKTLNGSESDAETIANGENETKTESTVQGNVYTKTIGSGQTLSFSVENKTVKNILDKIDKQIERLDECESYGSFSSCTYVLSENINVNMIASSLFNALISGEKSNIQIAKVNTWGIEDDEDGKVKQVLSYLSKLTHPQFSNYDDTMIFTPASLVSGRELAIQLGFPKKSIQGLSVVYKTPFGRNVIVHNKKKTESISIGNLYYMGSVDKEIVSLDLNSLSSHVLITGSTGTGKTNTTCKLIEKVVNNNSNIHFMVVEPAKGEYKNAFYNHPKFKEQREVFFYGTNPKKMELLRINPFSFPEEIHILEHIDRMVEIFNVCWPMYAAMPIILKKAIIKSYENCGWDIVNSCMLSKEKVYPGFSDVLLCINEILEESAFSSDNKGDYTGALCTRVESLSTGLNGMILGDNEIPVEILFEQNVIIDLSRIGAVETKSLIMGLLVMKLQEYRMASEIIPNQHLKHIMILEEAHNLLKKTSTEQSMESSNMTGKSVEMLTNSIAEMRAYGEGFFIIDQAPGLLDDAAIRNTNTKICLKLPQASDREIVGKAMALSDKQIIELSKLDRGCAVVYQNDWEEAVLCQFEQYHKDYENIQKDFELYSFEGNKHIKTQSEIKKELLKCLIDLVLNGKNDSKLDEKIYIDDILKELRIPYNIKSNIKRILYKGESCCLNDISGIIVKLYNAGKAIESSKDSPDIKTWNDNIIRSVDPELRKMSKKYMDVFVQCLLIEQTKKNAEFEPYVEAWKIKMREV